MTNLFNFWKKKKNKCIEMCKQGYLALYAGARPIPPKQSSLHHTERGLFKLRCCYTVKYYAVLERSGRYFCFDMDKDK